MASGTSLRGVIAESNEVGIDFQQFSSRILTTAAGYKKLVVDLERKTQLTDLEIDMFQSPHHDTVQTVLGHL